MNGSDSELPNIDQNIEVLNLRNSKIVLYAILLMLFSYNIGRLFGRIVGLQFVVEAKRKVVEHTIEHQELGEQRCTWRRGPALFHFEFGRINRLIQVVGRVVDGHADG